LLTCEQSVVTPELTELAELADEQFALVDDNSNKGFYYYDEEPVLPSNFDKYYTPGRTIILGAGAQTKHGREEIHFHSFSTLEKYFSFSDRNNARAREYYAFDQEIEAINIELDIENTYHNNPGIREEYDQRIRDLLFTLPIEMRPETDAISQEKVLVRLYRDCVPFPGNGNDGPFTPAMTQMPVMFFLNNAVSMFGRLSFFGINFIYDRSFYRRRLAVIRTTGFGTISFCPNSPFFPLNDRMSSGMFL
jgi:hypothetical protein